MKAAFSIIVASLLILAACATVQEAGKFDDFAKCLTQNGVKMYGAFWCPHCNAQKKMFGSSFQYIDYVECSLPDKSDQTAICKQDKIASYPTWMFKDGSRIEGEVTMIQLSDKSGCSLDLIQ